MRRMTAVILIFAGTLLSANISAEGKKLYKWTDKNGKVHYSDSIPPEAIEYKRKELNDRGLVVKEVARQKTTAELEAERLAARKAEEERQRRQKEIAKKNALDKILLDTFTTERDLLLTRDDRMSSVDSMITLTQSNNHTLQKQIEATEAQVERIQERGQAVPENITGKLKNLKGQMEKNKRFIASQYVERKRIEDQFAADLRRFQELKGIKVDKKLDTKAEKKAVKKSGKKPENKLGKQSATPQPVADKASPKTLSQETTESKDKLNSKQ